METLPITIPQARINHFCQQHHIRKLSLFGSVLREDFSSTSDIDMLVEFEPHHLPGYLRVAQMELELSEIMGWKVDLRTPAELSRYFRQDVLDSAQLLYDKN
jgi:predicted nucleotidyltransferase